MKKWAALLIACLLCVCCACAVAEEVEPETLTSGDFTYILLEDGTAEITGYKGSAETLEIPAELDGHTVSSIGDRAFFSCSSLTNVTIPDSVTSIGKRAFFWCYSLTSVTIPDSVMNIGVIPFEGCVNLTIIRVSPDHPTLAVIDGVLFSKADKRLVCYPSGKQETEYAVPHGIQVISDFAFFGCSSLTSVTIPDSVISIGEWAFFHCSSLNSVTLPDSVTSIGDCAFSDCNSLTGVTLPDSVTSIGDDAFYGCDNLTFTVPRDSFAAQYCKDNNLNYTYPDALDWLNN